MIKTKFCCATGSPVCLRTHLSVYLINTVYLWSVIDFIIEPWICLFSSVFIHYCICIANIGTVCSPKSICLLNHLKQSFMGFALVH